MASEAEQDLYDNADAKIRYEAYRCEFLRYEAYRWDSWQGPGKDHVTSVAIKLLPT